MVYSLLYGVGLFWHTHIYLLPYLLQTHTGAPGEGCPGARPTSGKCQWWNIIGRRDAVHRPPTDTDTFLYRTQQCDYQQNEMLGGWHRGGDQSWPAPLPSLICHCVPPLTQLRSVNNGTRHYGGFNVSLIMSKMRYFGLQLFHVSYASYLHRKISEFYFFTVCIIFLSHSSVTVTGRLLQ